MKDEIEYKEDLNTAYAQTRLFSCRFALVCLFGFIAYQPLEVI